MNEKKDPPKRKTIPRQTVMKEVFDFNYEDKRRLTNGKELFKAVIHGARSSATVKHDIIEAIMSEKHRLEEKHDQVPLDAQEREEQLYLEGKLAGLDMALKIAKEIK